MKGGEDDNCAVFLASTYACVNTKHPDDEHRAMYVGLTRTKQRLVLVDTDYKYRYEL
jgi:superfamily I DNA/RNA helicase